MLDKIAETRIFEDVCLKNPLVESVVGDHTQLSTEGFLAIFYEGPLSSWNYKFIWFLILHADFKLGADCLPLRGLRLLGSGLKRRLLSLGLHLMV